MGLFGPSKKEIALQNEIEELKSRLSPEQQDIVKLQEQIRELTEQKASLEATLSQQQNETLRRKREISQLDQEIGAKKGKIYSLDEDISMQEYGIYKPTYEFANSDLYADRLKAIRDEQKQCISKNNDCFRSKNLH